MIKTFGRLAASAAIALSLCTPAAAQIDARMFRYPDVSATHIAFVYAGDIWVVPKSGGMATRLTSAPEVDHNAVWSPDGTSVAFDSHREGRRQIFVKRADGAVPERVVYDGGEDDVRVPDSPPDIRFP